MASKTSSGIRVAVYGTLKKGHPNHRILDNENTILLGSTLIFGSYSMLNLSGFPGVVRVPEEGGNTGISCEVYRTDSDTLDRLDLLEGNGHFFTRAHIDTPWKKAWMYFLPAAEVAHYPRIVPIGEHRALSWRPTQAEQKFLNEYRKAG